jgi:RNA-directed DNA polymerase
MKRWDFAEMLRIGRTLFARIHRQKKYASSNHDVHFMARELNDGMGNWLDKGINALMDGTYTLRFLTCYYFEDAMVDQLHVSDRIVQHILLKQLKPTFPHVMNSNCYHLQGPSGVKIATARVKEVLKKNNPQYIIRAESWDYQELLTWFFNACWEHNPAAGFAAGLLLKAKKLPIEISEYPRVFEVDSLAVA